MSAAVPPVDLLLRAKNEASIQVKKLAADVGGLSETVARLSGGLGVWGAIAAGATAAGAAIITVSKNFSDEVQAIDRVRAATGAQVDQVQALQLAFREAGLTNEDANKALEKMAKAIGTNNPLLEKLGIHTRDVYQATLQASRAMANSDPALRSAAAVGLFGRSAGDAVGPIMQLASSAAEASKRLRETGAAFSQEDAERARRLHEALNDLALAWEGLGKSTASAMAPTATGMVNATSSIITAFANLQSAAQADESQGLLWWLKHLRDEGDKAGFAWIASMNADLDALTDRLHKFNPMLFAAADHSQAPPKQWDFGGISGPMDTEPPAPSATDHAREKKLKEIIETLRVGKKEAAGFLELLEGLSGDKGAHWVQEIFTKLGGKGKTSDLVTVKPRLRALEREGFVDHAAGVQGPEPKPLPQLMPAVDMKVSAPQLRAEVDALTERFPRLAEAITDVNIKWGEMVQSILSAQGIVDGAYGALFDGLQSGWHEVIAHMGSETQTWGSATKTILGAVADQLKALVAQMIATGIFKLVTQLITFAAGGAAGDAIPAGPLGGPGFGLPTPTLPPISALTPQRVVNLNISAIDADSAARASVLPFGSLRLAAESLGAIG